MIQWLLYCRFQKFVQREHPWDITKSPDDSVFGVSTVEIDKNPQIMDSEYIKWTVSLLDIVDLEKKSKDEYHCVISRCPPYWHWIDCHLDLWLSRSGASSAGTFYWMKFWIRHYPQRYIILLHNKVIKKRGVKLLESTLKMTDFSRIWVCNKMIQRREWCKNQEFLSIKLSRDSAEDDDNAQFGNT